MRNEETHGEGRGRTVDGERAEGVKVDPGESASRGVPLEVRGPRVEVAGGWAVEVGRSVSAVNGSEWAVVCSGPSVHREGLAWKALRFFRERSEAVAFAVAFVPWLDKARRWPTSEELARLEDLACPIVRTDATAGALVHGLVLGGMVDPASMLDRVAMAYAFGRMLDAAPSGQCTDDEDDRQRLALSLAGSWLGSRDVGCVREGLAMLERGERLEGFRLESWIVSVARLAGLRHAEVSK